VNLNESCVSLGVLAVIVSATGPKVRGFKFGLGQQIFEGDISP
jgi:hypothetical protein